MTEPVVLQAETLHAAVLAATLAGPLPKAIPGCAPWRAENGAGTTPAALCPSVYCERCQSIRARAGIDTLEPFTVPHADKIPHHDVIPREDRHHG